MSDDGPVGAENLTTKGRATRDRILSSATEIILADGLTGLSMDKVRMHAGVSGWQLTHYFTDKQTLVRAVLIRQIEFVMAIHRQPVIGGLDTWIDWENWIQVNVHHLRRFGYSGRPTYHGLAGQLTKVDVETREAVAQGYWRWIDFFEARLIRMKSSGALVAEADPHALALVVVAVHQGGCLISFAHRQAWPLANAGRFIVNYLRLFAADPAERQSRRPPRPWGRRRTTRSVAPGAALERRLTRKGFATRQCIVDGAAELMFERGVRTTSLDNVRAELQVSGSQLAHYFGDKRELIRCVIAVRSTGVQTFLSRPEFAGLTNLQSLRTWADACSADVQSVHLRGGCPYGSLVAELLEFDDVIAEELAAGYDQWIRRFSDGIAAMRRSGELTADADARHLAVSLLSAHQGGTTLAYSMGSATPCLTLVNAAVDYVASFAAAHRSSL